MEIIDSAAFLGVGSAVLRPWGKQNGMNEPGGLAIKFRKPEDVVSLKPSFAKCRCGFKSTDWLPSLTSTPTHCIIFYASVFSSVKWG